MAAQDDGYLSPLTNPHAAPNPAARQNPVQQFEFRGHYRIGLRSVTGRGQQWSDVA